jgi:hypothetical protein
MPQKRLNNCRAAWRKVSKTNAALLGHFILRHCDVALINVAD